jgi:hypothetical protein
MSLTNEEILSKVDSLEDYLSEAEKLSSLLSKSFLQLALARKGSLITSDLTSNLRQTFNASATVIVPSDIKREWDIRRSDIGDATADSLTQGFGLNSRHMRFAKTHFEEILHIVVKMAGLSVNATAPGRAESYSES